MRTERSTRARRIMVFAGLSAACAVLAVGYPILTRTSPLTRAPASVTVAADPAAIAGVASQPHLLFRNTSIERGYGQLAIVPLSGLDTPRVFTQLACERVHFASGAGLCLAAKRGMVTSYRMELFGADYRAQHTVALAGMPSRARVAPVGGLAALTYFVSGDSYAATGFSTRTLLVDRQNGNTLTNLENFTVTRDGTVFKSADFNFWGVTFAREPGKFYATLSSGGTMHLVEGHAATRTARVLRQGVECPSLSPDNRRVAFKRRMPGMRIAWRVHVLDLDTGNDTPLAETRSVDDQVEWLDDTTVLYALPASEQGSAVTNVWAVRADGTGEPRLFLANADSPAVVRPPMAQLPGVTGR